MKLGKQQARRVARQDADAQAVANRLCGRKEWRQGRLI